METVTDFIFLDSKIMADGDWSHEIKRCLLFGRKATRKLHSALKSRDITLLTFSHLDPSSQSSRFSSSHVWMLELDQKEVWGPKNWCFWTVVLEKALESPLDFCHNGGIICIFLLTILITACTSSSLTFPMIYSALNLNKQGDNI